MSEEQKPAAEGAEGASATENPNPPQHPAQVEGDGSAAGNGNGASRETDWKAKYFAQQRVTEKLSKRLDDFDQWRTQVTQPPAQSQSPSASEKPKSTFWDNANDPDAYLDSKIKNYVESNVIPQVNQQTAQKELKATQNMAEEYILSQSYVDRNSESDVEEIRKIFEERAFGSAWLSDPGAAAEGILEIFRARKGIGKTNGPSKSQAGSVVGNNAPAYNGNGQRIWTSKEIRDMKMEDYTRQAEDISIAQKEGRVRD